MSADRRERGIEFEHNGQRLRMVKSDGVAGGTANAFLVDPIAGHVLLSEYRAGMSIGYVKELARAAFEQLAERRAQIRLELQERQQQHKRPMD